jgi:hypothetical protein
MLNNYSTNNGIFDFCDQNKNEKKQDQWVYNEINNIVDSKL